MTHHKESPNKLQQRDESPILCVDIKLGEDPSLMKRIDIYKGDDLRKVAFEFAKANSLGEEKRFHLETMLRRRVSEVRKQE